MSADLLRIELAFANSSRQELLELDVSPDHTVGQIIDESGIYDLFPGEELQSAAVGIWGQPVDRKFVFDPVPEAIANMLNACAFVWNICFLFIFMLLKVPDQIGAAGMNEDMTTAVFVTNQTVHAVDPIHYCRMSGVSQAN